VADDIVTRLRVIHCAADDLTPCGTCLICQAADEIERLRDAGDALAERLRWWTDGTDEAYPDHQALQTWDDARRG
jgi:hypothetical protein